MGNLGVKQMTGGFGEGIILQASDMTFILILLTELSSPRQDPDPLSGKALEKRRGRGLGAFKKLKKA